MKAVIFGVIALLCFFGSSFTSRDSTNNLNRKAWFFCLFAAVVLHIMGLWETFRARPNALKVVRIEVWQNMELTTKEFTGFYQAAVRLEEENPGKPLGRVTITAESDRACGLSLVCSGINIVVDKQEEGQKLRTISFDIGKPPLILKIRADNPAVITFTGSHNIREYTLEFNNSLPSQLHPKEL